MLTCYKAQRVYSTINVPSDLTGTDKNTEYDRWSFWLINKESTHVGPICRCSLVYTTIRKSILEIISHFISIIVYKIAKTLFIRIALELRITTWISRQVPCPMQLLAMHLNLISRTSALSASCAVCMNRNQKKLSPTDVGPANIGIPPQAIIVMHTTDHMLSCCKLY